jgi:hypothetical protein
MMAATGEALFTQAHDNVHANCLQQDPTDTSPLFYKIPPEKHTLLNFRVETC